MRRIIFFDGPCPFCNWVVHFLMNVDHKKIFWFASLQGKTAQTLPKNQDSLILLEESSEGHKLFFEAKAVMRIFWLLGGKFRLLGWMYILPGFLINPCYRFVARNRYRLFSFDKSKELDESRLLP